MRKIKECLKENELFFSWINKQTYGLMEHDKQRITINIELHVLETFLHEYIHWRFPDKGERWVEKETNRRLKRMPIKDVTKYVKIIFKNGRMK